MAVVGSGQSPIVKSVARSAAAWLGYGPTPRAGLTITDAAITVALARPAGRRVVGVSQVILAPGVVIGDRILQRDRLSKAVRQAAEILGLSPGTPVALSLPTGRLLEQDATIRFRRTGIPLSRSVDRADRTEALAAVADAGLIVLGAEPLEASLARIVSLVTGEGENVAYVANCGWTYALLTVTSRFVDCEVQQRHEFLNRQDIRRGSTESDPGGQVDPFTWPRKLRPFGQTAMVAAAAALGAS